MANGLTLYWEWGRRDEENSWESGETACKYGSGLLRLVHGGASSQPLAGSHINDPCNDPLDFHASRNAECFSTRVEFVLLWLTIEHYEGCCYG